MTDLQWAVIEANLNPVVGAEQKGIRPVLVVSNEEYNQIVPNVTILPLTSTQRRLYPSEVLLSKGGGRSAVGFDYNGSSDKNDLQATPGKILRISG